MAGDNIRVDYDLINRLIAASYPSWTRTREGRSIFYFDPLWMLTRQWQMGEFQGEDAGTPVHARVRATSARLARANSRSRRGSVTTSYPTTKRTTGCLDATRTAYVRRRFRESGRQKSQTEHPGSQGVLQVPRGGVPADWPARDGYPAR